MQMWKLKVVRYISLWEPFSIESFSCWDISISQSFYEMLFCKLPVRITLHTVPMATTARMMKSDISHPELSCTVNSHGFKCNSESFWCSYHPLILLPFVIRHPKKFLTKDVSKIWSIKFSMFKTIFLFRHFCFNWTLHFLHCWKYNCNKHF